MTWIQLASGGSYDYNTGVITKPWSLVADVLRPLSRLPRFLGHTTAPWSVLDHSVLVSRALDQWTGDRTIALAGFVHDWHECLLGDIPTPLCKILPSLERLKREAQCALEDVAGLPEGARQGSLSRSTRDLVDQADLAALHVERFEFLREGARDWALPPPNQSFSRLMVQLFEDGKAGWSIGESVEWYRSLIKTS